MAFAGFVIDDKCIPTAEALEQAADREKGCGGYTYELLAWLADCQQDRGNRISTTTLTTKCLRSEALKRTMPYFEKPKGLWAAARGTFFHGVLEVHAHPRAIAEARYWTTWEGDPLSGSPDLVDPPAGYLSDYKNAKDMPMFYPWKGHIEQLQVNRWLVDHADRVEYQGDEFNLTDPAIRSRFVPARWDRLEVVYMDEKGSKPMTIKKTEQAATKVGGVKNVKVPDIWTDDRVENDLIGPRYEAAKKALNGDVPLWDDDFKYQSHPLCAYCPVREECGRRYFEEGR